MWQWSLLQKRRRISFYPFKGSICFELRAGAETRHYNDWIIQNIACSFTCRLVGTGFHAHPLAHVKIFIHMFEKCKTGT